MSFVSRRSRGSQGPSVATLNSQLKQQSNKLKRLPFQFPEAGVRTILDDYVSGRDVREYEKLIVSIRDSEFTDDDVIALINEAGKCVSILNMDLHLFVESLLTINWVTRSQIVTEEYHKFLLNLLSAHIYHTKYAIDKLVESFIPGNDDEWIDNVPTAEESTKYYNIHWFLNRLLQQIPMAYDVLMHTVTNHFPYLKKSAHVHEVYLQNLLWIINYAPSLRQGIFRLIISKLVLLDVNAPREEIIRFEAKDEMEEVFSFEDVTDTKNNLNQIKHPIGHTLDICMDKLLTYIVQECHDQNELIWDKAKEFYHDMLNIFEDIILPTYNTHHVQYILFIICSLKTTLTEAFLNYLWTKVTNPRVAPVIRQSSIAYVASLVARGNFVPIQMLKGTLQQIAAWIHGYITSQDGNEYINCTIKSHGVFYSVCQALFYVIAFRHKDLVNSKKNISFLSSLNLAKIVTCKLNPLRVCQPAVVQNFAAVTRTYQLAYCYTIMEHNSRNVIPVIYQDEKGAIIESSNVLDPFFPFDPYALERSGKFVSLYYIDYQKFEDSSNISIKQKREFEDDDFLGEQSNGSCKEAKLARFSYSTSPGFKQIT